MTKDVETNRWRITTLIAGLSVVSTLIIGAVAIISPYSVRDLGAIPKRTVSVHIFGPLSPLVLAFNTEVKLSATINGQVIDNVRVATLIITNTSISPILPNDIYENISITAELPWKIVSIDGQKVGSTIPFTWIRQSEGSFSATPTLLNPGDSNVSTVYLSGPAPKVDNGTLQRVLHVDGRIINMTSFTETQILSIPQPKFWLISAMYNWEIIAFLALFILYQGVYLFYLLESNLFGSTIRIICMLASGIVSLCAAEAICSYSYGVFTNSAVLSAGSAWLNLPIIILNLVMTITLVVHSYVAPRTRRLRSVSRTSRT